MIDATSTRAGRVVEVPSGPDGYSAFVPTPLPPEPPLDVGPRLQRLLDEANQALGRLDGVTLLLPDPGQFRTRRRPEFRSTTLRRRPTTSAR